MKNKVKKIGTHTWIFPLNSAKDRPNLGYVLGENMALAIDAGHSSSHVEDFYQALTVSWKRSGTALNKMRHMGKNFSRATHAFAENMRAESLWLSFLQRKK